MNLPMAMYAGADVILVADIDRGGVFASVYGSVMLLTPEERKHVKGILINKFRGDIRLFESGVKMLEELCGIPVVGVVPYYKDIYIEEEDSLALATKSLQAEQGKVNIAVVLLRHLSNFTDFNVLERDPRVHLFYTNNTEELEETARLIFTLGTREIRYLTADEVNGITDFIRPYSTANYDSGVLDELDRLANMGNDGDEDDPDANSTVDEYSSADRDLFSQCVEMAVRDREVSTSLIQRRLKLGYARAGRLVDEMEQRGIISAKDGAKPRRCLISMEQYEAMKASGELK